MNAKRARTEEYSRLLDKYDKKRFEIDKLVEEIEGVQDELYELEEDPIDREYLSTIRGLGL